jgi:exodeoxyribonuclease VII large subunit
MPRQPKSQWDFGELFPPQAIYPVVTVSELTSKIRRLLEKEVGQVWVTGEVTNLRTQSSGHIYFVLKDADAQLSCVLFRGELVPHRELLEDGHKLVVQGDITVYGARGQYQLIVRSVDLQGTGALQIAFEKLKAKLQAEGLFAQERKRPIARYPVRVGLVTSPTGAAIHDILHVIERRHAGLELLLATCKVQGPGSAEEIACAIELLNKWHQPNSDRQIDVILVARGGGSLEDLWAFNEERVARAIFDSALPVVSAVGHEIDFTISDFVADLRAATPSAAAELLTEGYVASRRFVQESAQDLIRLVTQHFERDQQHLHNISQRLQRLHPRRQLDDRFQYLDDLQASLVRTLTQRWRDQRTSIRHLHQRLWRVNPSFLLEAQRRLVSENRARLREKISVHLRRQREHLSHLAARLRVLSPENVLNRGYSITRDAATGKVIRKAAEVKPSQKLRTKLKTGEISSTAD